MVLKKVIEKVLPHIKWYFCKKKNICSYRIENITANIKHNINFEMVLKKVIEKVLLRKNGTFVKKKEQKT